MDGAINCNFVIDPWKIVECKFSPEYNEVTESIFSIANEYMGARGNFEEGFVGKTLPGCYIGGIFIKERQSYIWKRRGFPTFSNSMVNTTNWLAIKIIIDGEEFCLSRSEFQDYRRELNMKSGILSRSLIFKTKSGLKTELGWERFISHHDRHLGAIRLNVKTLNHQKLIKIHFLLDRTKENRDFDNSIVHCKSLFKKADVNGLLLLTKVDTTGQYYINRMHVEIPKNLQKFNEEYLTDDKYIDYSISFLPEEKKVYSFDKLISVWTSRDAGYPYGLISKENNTLNVDSEKENELAAFILRESKEHLASCREQGYELLKKNHMQCISNIWDNLDIEIVGDDLAQQGIRYCMFQLFNTYLGNDSFLNIGAKGYTGECYNGRTFWDSESYCLPFYLFTNPAAARNLIEYRYNTLHAARARAREFGHSGAIFPMTTIDGTEDCGVWEYAFGEIHINSAIAYAIFVYTHLYNDSEYLYSKGIEVLIEIARFWNSRTSYIPYRNGYAINRVTGPDEYQQLVNNNFYTNYMAKWVLEYTAQTVLKMQNEAPNEFNKIAKKINLQIQEPIDWQNVASKMILNYDPDLDIFLQDDMFLSLDPICREELDRERDIPIERKWTIDKFLRNQLIKQADVLLAMFLFRDRFTLDQKKSNYRFYEQRTVHCSSLSPCIHSIIASEIGRFNQAYAYYIWASRLDLDNFNNNTQEGLHISSMAGTWLAIICGFGGMRYTGESLEFSPILPKSWQKYSFKLEYHKSTIRLIVDSDKVIYHLIAGNNIDIKIYGKKVQVNKTIQSIPIQHQCSLRDKPEAVLFDLDGVIVDTAKSHYMAWKELADSEGIYFDENINQRLRGVDRNDSLKILLEKQTKKYSAQEKTAMLDRKNQIYRNLLKNIDSADILPGIRHFINDLKEQGIKLALVSSSKNADFIVEAVGIREWFDVIITGNDIKASKPDPECFLTAAKRLNVIPANCIVIEDAIAGIEAARLAGMKSIGIGDKTILHKADYALSSTRFLKFETVVSLF